RRRKTGNPVSRNVLAATNPNVTVAENVLDKTDQCLGPARMARQAHGQADRHDTWPVGPFFVEEVEAVAQKVEEILAGPEDATAKLRIVGGQRVGYHEVWLVTDPHPIGQLVVIGVAVIEKTAMLDQQPAGVFRWRIAAIPAGRGLAGSLADQVDGRCNLPPLFVFGEPGMIDPAIAVAACVPVARSDRRRRRRVCLERPCATKDRHWDPEASEDPMKAPEADPGPIFEHALGTKVAACDS